ncbi:MAG: hypothetical protein ABI175_10305 [Polyangiales bacterium]
MNDLHAHLPPVTYPALRSIPTQPLPLLDVDVAGVPVLVEGAAARRGSVEAFLMSKIDGVRSIAEIAVLASLSPREVLHLVAGMVHEGSVDIGQSRRSQSSVRRRIDPAAEPSLPLHGFVDFADIFEELDLPQSAPAVHTPSQPRVTIPSHPSHRIPRNDGE